MQYFNDWTNFKDKKFGKNHGRKGMMETVKKIKSHKCLFHRKTIKACKS